MDARTKSLQLVFDMHYVSQEVTGLILMMRFCISYCGSFYT